LLDEPSGTWACRQWIVGVQPFGGEGLSGTGPKAGGPYYLQRFATERTVTINTAAVGGNASLFAISGEEG